MKRMDALAILALSAALASPATACIIPPGPEQIAAELHRVMERADHVFIAEVDHITRRRWGPDDDQPSLNDDYKRMLARDGEDPKMQHFANWTEYAEATAFLKPEFEIYRSGLIDTHRPFGDGRLVPIDMLRPFRINSDGGCYSFPQTCHWDIRPGSRVAVAMQENRFGAQTALLCRVIEEPVAVVQNDLRKRSGSVTKFDAMLPYLKGEYPWLQPDSPAVESGD